jgi:DNA-directed RNA polymerase subunit RPC12/RpoP
MGHKSHAELYNCPNCNAQYKLVRAEADHVGLYGQIECYHCGGPLKSGEGQFIFKYFLVDRPRKQLKPSRVE